MATHAEQAIKYFTTGYNCAQSVIMAYSEHYDVPTKQASLLAAGFGGGMGRKQYTCGAVTGAVMVLGCVLFDESKPVESKTRVYENVRAFMNSFEEAHTCSDCKGLLGVDLSTSAGVEEAKARNVSREVCDDIIRDVCDRLDSIIRDEEKIP